MTFLRRPAIMPSGCALRTAIRAEFLLDGNDVSGGVQHVRLERGDVPPMKRKSVTELSNASEATPEWFAKGVEAARIAPTALNQQRFYFEYVGKNGGQKDVVRATRRFSLAGSAIDLGIVKLHFEIGAGTENFEWEK